MSTRVMLDQSSITRLFRFEIEGLLRCGFNDDCSAIAQDLCDTGRDLGSIIAHCNHSIGTKLEGMLDHALISISTGPLAQLGVDGNIAADDLLEGRTNVADDTARAHDDPTYDAKVPHDAIAVQLHRSGDKGMNSWPLR